LGREAAKLRRSPLALTVIALFILVTAFISVSSFYADLLWFRSVGYTSVWQTTLFTKVVLFIGAGLITAIVVLANVIIAYRNRPVYAPMAVEVDNQSVASLQSLFSYWFFTWQALLPLRSGHSGCNLQMPQISVLKIHNLI
jgi:uncharacterized membrane protein (UPF0182 family)